MSFNEVEFETDREIRSDKGLENPSQRVPPKGILGWLIKKKIVPNERRGRYILSAVIVIDFVIAAYVYYFFILQ